MQHIFLIQCIYIQIWNNLNLFPSPFQDRIGWALGIGYGGNSTRFSQDKMSDMRNLILWQNLTLKKWQIPLCWLPSIYCATSGNFFLSPLHRIILVIFQNAKNERHAKTGNQEKVSRLGVPSYIAEVIQLLADYNSINKNLQISIYIILFTDYSHRQARGVLTTKFSL